MVLAMRMGQIGRGPESCGEGEEATETNPIGKIMPVMMTNKMSLRGGILPNRTNSLKRRRLTKA